MSIYETMLLMTATAVILLSLFAGNIRGSTWVALIAIDLVVTTAWWRAGLPYGDAFTAVFDFSICAAIYFFGRHRWELYVFLIFQCSMLVSIIDLAAMIWAPGWIDHDVYSSVLEILNYLAFITTGTVSGFIFANRSDVSALRAWSGVWSFDRLVRAKGEVHRTPTP